MTVKPFSRPLCAHSYVDVDALTPCMGLTQSKAELDYSAFLSVKSASALGDEI